MEKQEPYPLLEFLFRLLDIQIKKYQQLVKIGVGPDAKMNARLVCDEVSHLFQLTEALLNAVETETSAEISIALNNTISQTLQQVNFYIECEYLRARAAWLIDENKIHNPEYERLVAQRKELSELLSSTEPNINSPLQLSEKQKQLQHDSHEIAFLILNIAATLKKDPAAEIENAHGFNHGMEIMLKHAQPGGRYHQAEIWQDIETRRSQSETFLASSSLQKSGKHLEKEIAETHAHTDKGKFAVLLKRFEALAPNSTLFTSALLWYNVGKSSPLVSTEKADDCCSTWKKHIIQHRYKYGLFAVAAGLGFFTWAVYRQMEETATPDLTPQPLV